MDLASASAALFLAQPATSALVVERSFQLSDYHEPRCSALSCPTRLASSAVIHATWSSSTERRDQLRSILTTSAFASGDALCSAVDDGEGDAVHTEAEKGVDLSGRSKAIEAADGISNIVTPPDPDQNLSHAAASVFTSIPEASGHALGEATPLATEATRQMASSASCSAWSSGRGSSHDSVADGAVTSMARRQKALRARQGSNLVQSEGQGALVVEGMKIGEDTLLSRAFWMWGRWVYRDWLVQENKGLENVPLHRGTFLMASNHSSHLDCGAAFMAAWAAGAKRVYALGARDYFFKDPFTAWFVTTFMSVIPINRRGFSQHEVDILLRVKQMSGPSCPSAILIFPEGTRSTTGSLQRFKTGVAFLAEQLDVPVVPTCVKGTIDALPKGRSIPYRHKVTVEFGQPLEMPTFLMEELKRIGTPGDSIGQNVNGNSFVQGTLREGEVVQEVSIARDKERALKRSAQTKFAEALRTSIALMLGPPRAPKKQTRDQFGGSLPLAVRLGGGKWILVGWLLYWLPMAGFMVAAVAFAASQSWKARVYGGGYAAMAAVFAGQAKFEGAGVFICLGILMVAFYVRVVIQMAWPYFVLAKDD